MSKYTAGPWSVQLCKGSYQRPALVVAGKKLVASCLGDQLEPQATSIGEAEANARLIAACPDLLAACEFAVQWLDGEDAEILKVAIAKARGK